MSITIEIRTHIIGADGQHCLSCKRLIPTAQVKPKWEPGDLVGLIEGKHSGLHSYLITHPELNSEMPCAASES